MEFNPGGAASLDQAVKLRYEANPDTNAFGDAEKAKLAAIAPGATANAADAALRNRATHTGSQPIATVAGLQPALDAKAALGAAQSFTGAQGTAVVTLSDAPAIATDASLSNQFKVTLGANRVMAAPTELVEGRVYEWEIRQDGTGGRTLTWAAIFRFPGDAAPMLQTAAGASDIVTARFNGTSLHCIHSGGWMA